jgi:hypothetical protein
VSWPLQALPETVDESKATTPLSARAQQKRANGNGFVINFNIYGISWFASFFGFMVLLFM